MPVLSVPGATCGGVGGTKPIWGEVVWGEGGRDGGSSAGGSGSTAGAGAGAASASAFSFSRAWRARTRARRVASRRYWSLEKGVELQDAEYPRGYFCGVRNLSSFWYSHIWVSAVSRRRRGHSQRIRASTKLRGAGGVGWGYFCGVRNLSSFWYSHIWVSAVSRRRRVHSQRIRSSTKLRASGVVGWWLW